MAEKRDDTVCISAGTGEGVDQLLSIIQDRIRDLLVDVQILLPYNRGELLEKIHRLGVVDHLVSACSHLLV